MFWWRITPLKEQLLSGGPSQSDQMKYLLATLAFYVIAGEAGFLAAEADPEATLRLTDWISSLVFIVCTCFGTYYCYRRNLAGDGRRFVERFICIGWPVSIRFFVFLLVALVSLGVADHLIGGEASEPLFESGVIAFTILAEVIFYWYLGSHIHDIATQRD